MILARVIFYMLTRIMVLAHIIVLTHVMVLAVNPYYGATLFFGVACIFMSAVDPYQDVNLCSGDSLLYGVSPSDGVGGQPM